MFFAATPRSPFDVGEVIVFEGNIGVEKGTAAYITFCVAIGSCAWTRVDFLLPGRPSYAMALRRRQRELLHGERREEGADEGEDGHRGRRLSTTDGSWRATSRRSSACCLSRRPSRRTPPSRASSSSSRRRERRCVSIAVGDAVAIAAPARASPMRVAPLASSSHAANRSVSHHAGDGPFPETTRDATVLNPKPVFTLYHLSTSYASLDLRLRERWRTCRRIFRLDTRPRSVAACAPKCPTPCGPSGHTSNVDAHPPPLATFRAITACRPRARPPRAHRERRGGHPPVPIAKQRAHVRGLARRRLGVVSRRNSCRKFALSPPIAAA